MQTNTTAITSIDYDARPLMDFLEKKGLDFRFQRGNPVRGRLHTIGRSRTIYSVYVQIIGIPETPHSISASLVIGPHSALNDAGARVLGTVVHLIDPSMLPWFVETFNTITKKTDLSRQKIVGDRVFTFRYVPYAEAGSCHISVEPSAASMTPEQRREEVDRLALLVRRWNRA